MPFTAAQTGTRESLRAGLVRGLQSFEASHFEEARLQFESIRKAGNSSGDSYIEIRATGNIGGCWFALHNYREALQYFSTAHQLALKNGDRSAAAAYDANIASLYSEMGELDSAISWLERSMSLWTGVERDAHLPQLQIEMGALRARQGRMADAAALFRSGIEGGERAGNPAVTAVAWNRWGEELMRSQDPASAERPLLEAYRIRKLNGLALEASYTNLGKVGLALGDLSTASMLLDRAVETRARMRGAMPAWDAYLARGEVRLRRGRPAEALEDLRIAVRLARAWRWSIPAGDASNVGAEGVLDRIYGALVEAGNSLYQASRNPALLRETFEAAEENRASSLRVLLQERQTAGGNLPPKYWEAVYRLQRAEVAAIRGNDAAGQEAVRTARSEVVRMESELMPGGAPLSGNLMERTQAALDPETALLSFRLGDSRSWLWALDRNGASLYDLPGRREVEEQVRKAAEAIAQDLPDADEAGARLFETLFGRLEARYRDKQRWLLGLDAGLFEAPIAALRETGTGRRAYVAERHVTQVIPGAGFWLDSVGRSGPPPAPRFLGVGDAIYNRADPRLQRANPPARLAFRLVSRSLPAQPRTAMALPRLVASGPELDACARLWKGSSVLLKGADASRKRLAEELTANPMVVHLATHFVSSPRRRSEGYVALSLDGRNEPELIAPSDIARWRIHTGLVVLSGCHSAVGPALPGTGLMGLTRAWLTAGARSVLASRWAVPDEEGSLFAAFYGELRAGSVPDAAQALRKAQLRMIHASDWRARPRYWAAYFVVGEQ